MKGLTTFLSFLWLLAVPVAASPNLGLEKDDGGVSAGAGATIAYTLTYRNSGTDEATGVVLTETVPESSSLDGAASTPGWLCVPDASAGSSCSRLVGSMAAGEVASAVFAVSVDDPLGAGVTRIENTGTISDDGANGPDPDPSDNTASDETPISSGTAPDLAILKQDGGASVEAGGTIAYKLSYQNLGNQNASGVVVTDTVPEHTTFNASASSSGWVCAPDGNAGSTCDFLVGDVGGGDGGFVIFGVTVDSVPPLDNVITNLASITDDGSGGLDPDPSNNFDGEVTPIGGGSGLDLILLKSDGGLRADAGGVVSYTLSYQNIGNEGAGAAVLFETVPEHTTFNAATSSAGWFCNPDGSAGSTCTLVLGAVSVGSGGEVLFAVTVEDPLAAGVQEISNSAEIRALLSDGSPGNDSNPLNNVAIDETPINFTTAPDLVLVKDDGGISVDAGDTTSYTLTYQNIGNQDASGVVLMETVPARTSFNASASSSGWVCGPDGSAGSACALIVGSLPADGVAASVTFAVDVEDPLGAGVQRIVNFGSIRDDGTSGGDLDPLNNTAGDETPINVSTAPDLRLLKEDGGVSVDAGGVVVYVLTYHNPGSQDATGVVITETVPAHTSFEASASSPGWVCLPDGSAGSTCTVDAGSLPVGSVGSVSFSVLVDDPLPAGVEEIANTAVIRDDGLGNPDLNPADNTASDTTPVGTGGGGGTAPNYGISKDDGGVSAEAGAVVVYTLTYANGGNQGGTGVVLTETVPAHTRFDAASSSAGWSCVPDGNAGSTCTLNVGSLAGGGAGGSAELAVLVDDPLPAGVSQILNEVTISDDGTNGPDPNPVNNTATDTTPIGSMTAPDLAIGKSDGGQLADPGDTIEYTLGYENLGNQGATGVMLTETVPEHTAFNAASSSAGWWCVPDGNAGSTCTLDLGVLEAGDTGQASFAVDVALSLPSGVDQILNTVVISDDGSNGPDRNPGDNTASEMTGLGSGAVPDLTITLDDGGIVADAGDTVVYTVDYGNSGAQGATGVRIMVLLPPDVAPNLGASSAGWSCARVSCTYDVGALASLETGSLDLALDIDTPLPAGVEQLLVSAMIADDGANGRDLNPADNSDEETTPIGSGGGGGTAPDLTITKDDGGIVVDAGGTIAYVLSYTNQGNQGASGVVLSDTVPANTTFDAEASSAGWVCSPDAGAGSSCSLSLVGELAGDGAGGSVIFAVVVDEPLAAGVSEIVNTASISDDGTSGSDADPSDNSDSDTTPINLGTAPDLRLSKDDGGVSVDAGGIVTYILGYQNLGSQDASGVLIVETVPSHASFEPSTSSPGCVLITVLLPGNVTANPQASSPGWSCSAVTCSFDVGTLASGAAGGLELAVDVDDPLPAGVQQILILASIADDGLNGPDLNTGDNSDSDTTVIGTGPGGGGTAPDLSLRKDDGGITVPVGSLIEYILTYANHGNQGAAGVVVGEAVPEHTTFAGLASSPGWACLPDGSAGSFCIVEVGEVAAGESGQVVFAVVVDPSTPDGVTEIENIAGVADDGSNGDDQNPLDNSAFDTTPLSPLTGPDLAIVKSDHGQIAGLGETIFYVLSYGNLGPGAAGGVVLREVVPEHTTFSAGQSSAAGQKGKSTKWQTVVTVEIDPPETTEGILKNPLGLYVTEISWTQVL